MDKTEKYNVDMYKCIIYIANCNRYMTNILSAVIYFPISRNFAIGFFTIFSNIIANYYVDKFIIRKHDKWFRPSIFFR